MLQCRAPQMAGLRLVLASASPRRRQILAELGLNVEVVGSRFEENLDKEKLGPVPYVTATALGKANEVHERLKGEAKDMDLIISADTIVVLEDKILEKPSSEDHAREMLRRLSGSTHTVHTAVVLLLPKQQQHSAEPAALVRSFHESTQVTFADLSDEMINAYVATGSPMDKAGAYGIQEVTGGSLIRGINGCYYNVVGFPLHRFCTEVLDLLDHKLL